MEIIEGETFSGESVELDDKHLINGRFIDCILEYHGGEVRFDRTHMNGCWSMN